MIFRKPKLPNEMEYKMLLEHVLEMIYKRSGMNIKQIQEKDKIYYSNKQLTQR